ncbi:site-specific integrase [Lacticaseibacillus saniviri]
MATIRSYETKDGLQRYEISVYIGTDELTGRKKYIHRRGFESKKEATLAASRLNLDASTSDLTKRKKLSFKQVYEQWDTGYINSVRSSSYRVVRSNFTHHILPLFGGKRIDRITTSQLQKAVNQWADESISSYARWLRDASRVLNYAVRQGYISANPAKMVIIPKKQEIAGEQPENFWDKDELAAFFSYIDLQKKPQQYALFRVLAFSGIRRGECLALTWADVSFTDNTIAINKTVAVDSDHGQIIQAPKTRAGKRTIPMDEKTMAILKNWRLQQMKKYMALGYNTNTPTQLVFANRSNELLNLMMPSEWLKTIEIKNNIEHHITIHGFRHSHASLCLAAGMNIKELQVRLGHENPEMTMKIYLHVTQTQSEQAAKLVANYMNF